MKNLNNELKKVNELKKEVSEKMDKVLNEEKINENKWYELKEIYSSYEKKIKEIETEIYLNTRKNRF
jgi:hypothetical protein